MINATALCAISKKEFPKSELHLASDLRKEIFNLIVKENPTFTGNDFICVECLNEYRKKYLQQIINDNEGEINTLEKDVIDSITKQEIIADKLDIDTKDKLTFGQKIADKVATFGGSWRFIIIFFLFILVWMIVNSIQLLRQPFDTFPFILLNLILSCLAAIQAPIIMMSQNRQEEKDRLRSEHDYKINLKAELEIRLLHDKLDHLLAHQNQRLFAIQQLQTEYFEDILKQIKP